MDYICCVLLDIYIYIYKSKGIRDLMATLVGNGYGDMSSNPRRDRLYFTYHYYSLETYESN